MIYFKMRSHFQGQFHIRREAQQIVYLSWIKIEAYTERDMSHAYVDIMARILDLF